MIKPSQNMSQLFWAEFARGSGADPATLGRTGIYDPRNGTPISAEQLDKYDYIWNETNARWEVDLSAHDMTFDKEAPPVYPERASWDALTGQWAPTEEDIDAEPEAPQQETQAFPTQQSRAPLERPGTIADPKPSAQKVPAPQEGKVIQPTGQVVQSKKKAQQRTRQDVMKRDVARINVPRRQQQQSAQQQLSLSQKQQSHFAKYRQRSAQQRAAELAKREAQ